MKASEYCVVVAVIVGAMFAGCAIGTTHAPRRSAQGHPPSVSTRQLDPSEAQRLQQVMLPLLQHMNHPLPPSRVRVGIIDDPHINAANAGGGEFFVTTGLLRRANDDQLRAVMAHETAHADLGHVAKLQTLGAGLNVGMIILDQIIPGSRALTPLAGQLVANAYTRKEEYEADAHGAAILRRAGYDGKTLMINTLFWLKQTEGESGGGFFATHPGTGDRIEALRHTR